MAAPSNGSPFPPISQVPLHKNPPLAPSQELAYRSKCIELRRRLTEIERQNDEFRKRIARERRAQDKMRLNRAILLNHLKEMVENGKRLTPEQLQALGSGTTAANGTRASRYMDADSDGTEEEEIAEPQDRPLRSKRANHRGDITMNVSPSVNASTNNDAKQSTPPPQTTPVPSQQPHEPSHLPALAPASSPIPPPPPQESLQTSYRITPPSGPSSTSPPATDNDAAELSNPAPIRPIAPFDKFSEYHTRQLQEQGSVPVDSIPSTIRRMWNDASEEDKKQAEDEYRAEMQQYEKAMDEWKKANRKSSGGGTGTPSGSFQS